MSARFTRLAWGLLVGACLLGLFLSSGQAQNAKAIKIEELIPAKTVLFGSWDGAAAHQAAFEKTAAHDAFYKSGLVPLIEKLVASIQQQAQAKLGGNEQAARLRAGSIDDGELRETRHSPEGERRHGGGLAVRRRR